jgi:low temperature requirement protein LtrA
MASEPTEAGFEEKSASYLELFFDLVFVFAITQVSSLLHADPTFSGLAKGAFLLILMWWTWSQYTWTTNWTGTDRVGIRLSLIGAMAAALVMAVAVPRAFDTGGLWFAIAYLMTRGFAGAMFWIGARHHSMQRAALLTYLPLSMLAPVIVLIGGFFGGTTRIVIWVAAFLIDLAGAARAGRGTWKVDGGHFAERNGLFVIIALGESIVAIGVGAAAAERGPEVVVSLGLTFAGAAVLWWSYFDRAAHAVEDYLKGATGLEQGHFARDAYTLLHIPVVLGIVMYAVAAEEVVAHAERPLGPEFRLAMAAGIVLVLLGMMAAVYRAHRRLIYGRVWAAIFLGAIALAGGRIRADVLTGLMLAVVAIGLWRERTHYWTDTVRSQ